MIGLNKVMLIGRLGKDPEIRSTNSGARIASFSIATSETWRDKQSGERKEKVSWHNVVIFNENLAKVVEQYTRKGSQIYVEGSLQTRKYDDNQGITRYVTEVVLQNFNGTITLLDSKRDGDGGGGGGDYGAQSGASYGGRNHPSGPRESFAADLDGDIPF